MRERCSLGRERRVSLPNLARFYSFGHKNFKIGNVRTSGSLRYPGNVHRTHQMDVQMESEVEGGTDTAPIVVRRDDTQDAVEN